MLHIIFNYSNFFVHKYQQGKRLKRKTKILAYHLLVILLERNNSQLILEESLTCYLTHLKVITASSNINFCHGS